MTIVSKASAYPKSVQSGLPRLGTCPPGWTRGPLSAHLIEELRPLNMADDEVYDLVTVKRSRGGVVLRERLKGSEIAVKTQFRLKAGDFLISKRQIVHGACGIVPPELDGAIVSNEYSILRARPTLDLDFLNCLAHSIYFQQTCFHSSIGVHVEKMIFKLDEWMKWDFDLPAPGEQSRIAEVLATWDRAIEKLQVLVANARKQKMAVMQTLLTGTRRLPSFESEWRSTPISEMGATISGGTPDSTNPAYWDGDVAWATPTDITKLRTPYISRTDRFITAAGLSSSAAKLLPASTVIVCTRASVGVLAIATVPMATNQGFKNIVPNQNHDSTFLYYLLSFNGKALVRAAGGSTFLEVSKADFERLTFKIPAIDEQRAIASVLTSADEARQKLESGLAALRQEKAALMQQLLTGKRRVNVAEGESA
jgi:type I restriction enzyme S subunit